jgi:hypothetical protein
MPPRDNKAKAKNLTPEQLGLLKLWIDQGAKPSPKRERVIAWQPLAQNLGAIFAVAVTGDGQFAACSRANRLFIYHIPSGRLIANEAAHRDQINALAFSPDGTLLATGGYREVKLWRRVPIEGKPAQPLAGATGKITRADGQRFVTIEASAARLCSADGKVIAELRGNRFARELADERDRALQVETGTVAYRKEAVVAAEKTLQAAQDRVKKSADAIPAKQQELDAKTEGARRCEDRESDCRSSAHRRGSGIEKDRRQSAGSRGEGREARASGSRCDQRRGGCGREQAERRRERGVAGRSEGADRA